MSGPDSTHGFFLWHAALAWKGAMSDALAELDLTPTQFFALGSAGWLEKTSGPPSQKDVADHAGLDVMTASQVLRALEKRELIVRRDHATDTRAFALSLTPKGRALVQKASPKVRAADAAFFADVSDSQMAHTRGALEKLAVKRRST